MSGALGMSEAAPGDAGAAFVERIGPLVGDAAWDEVRDACEAAIVETGEAAEVLYVRALAAFVQDDVSGALRFAERAFEADHDILETADLLSVLYALVGDIHSSSYYGKMVTALESHDGLAALKRPAALPDFGHAFLNIAERPLLRRALSALELGLWSEAEHWFGQHAQIEPDCREAHLGLGHCLLVQGLDFAAVQALRAALHALPGDAALLRQLGMALTAVGAFAEARAVHRAAAAASDDPAVHAQAALDRIPDPEQEPAAIVGAFADWGRRFGVAGVSPPPAAGGGGRLTVGYLIAGVNRRQVAPALARILAQHDRGRFRVVGLGFGSLGAPDNAMWQKAVEGWTDVRDFDPLTLASVVGAEGVDVLVDVGGFAMPKLLAGFGARMAPLQVSWLGAPAGTGLAAMDALFLDGVMAPEGDGAADGFREEIVRLEHGCPVIEAPVAPPVPAPEADRPLTLAADATLGELNPTTVAAWAGVLHDAPEATLVLVDHDFHSADNAAQLISLFGDHGVSHRIDIVSRSSADALFAGADLVLLPFPALRLGVVTAALGAGVPMVASAGHGAHHRAAASVLHHLGLGDDMVAADADGFRSLARRWIDDADGRRSLASTLASRLEESPFLDPRARAGDLEARYEALWPRFGGGAG